LIAKCCYNRLVLKIGYLVPEFPGQTHTFFWREIRALRALGVGVDLLATRRPPRAIISHAWAGEAMRQTFYLHPPDLRGAAAAAAEIARSAPDGWARCAAAIARAEGESATGRIRLAGLAVMGARLAARARERGFSHVHVHSSGDAAHVAMFAHLLSGLDYSITLHAPLAEYGVNHREKWRHARFGIVITRTLRAELVAALAGSLPETVEIAPMGVELDRFSRAAPYEPWSGAGPLRIFSCGRLNPAKGHSSAVVAVQLLRSRGIDARLAIGGEDEHGGTAYRRVLAAEIEAAKLGGAVELLGAISEDRVKRELEKAHVFCLASQHEPLGVAIMEAMAMSLPVVVTRAGGVPELVDDGHDGVFVPPDAPAAIADAIEVVARDPALARRLGENARRTIEKAFDSRRSAALLAALADGAARGDRVHHPRGAVNGVARTSG
jgi:glycosyltransferase involved in cell wall biosynthesis